MIDKIQMFNWMEIFNFHRFPKDRNISKQWNLALGFDVDKFIGYGCVCFKHFARECFDGQKLKTNAVPTIIDECVAENSIVPNVQTESITSVAPNLCSSSTTTAGTVDLQNIPCMECEQKNQLMKIKDVKIKMLSMSCQKKHELLKVKEAEIQELSKQTNELQKIYESTIQKLLEKNQMYDALEYSLQEKDDKIHEMSKLLDKSRKKVWYLEKVKQKLNTTISKLSESLITDDQRLALEVLVY